MRKFLYLITCFTFSSGKPDCIEISNKYGGNGIYYFEFEDRDSDRYSESEYGANPSTLVSEKTFNEYNIGYTYCVD
jgi:hypothetical protein